MPARDVIVIVLTTVGVSTFLIWGAWYLWG